MFKIFLYGISGVDKQYKVLKYFGIDESEVSIKNIRYQAVMMRVRNPSIEHVYAIDYRPGLKYDYIESYKKNTIESCAIFKDILEREGIKII